MRSAILHYFNAAGADRDGEQSEEHDPETHLIPRCLMAAGGHLDAVEIFGYDYPTPDETCIRDYIHVEDLASGHVAALAALPADTPRIVLNLGTGQGTSVQEILDAVERLTGRKVPHVIRPRRPGDPPELPADVSAARRTIGFEARCSDIDTIISTAAPTFIR
jgi:UDP-arabinose 4-epimerase